MLFLIERNGPKTAILWELSMFLAMCLTSLSWFHLYNGPIWLAQSLYFTDDNHNKAKVFFFFNFYIVQVYLSQFWRLESPRSRHQQIWCLVRASSWFIDVFFTVFMELRCIECLLCLQFCAKRFVQITLLNPHSSMKLGSLPSPFHIWGNWSSGRRNDGCQQHPNKNGAQVPLTPKPVIFFYYTIGLQFDWVLRVGEKSLWRSWAKSFLKQCWASPGWTSEQVFSD